MKKSRKVVLLGDSAFAEIAYEYFSQDSEYEVVGFSVESGFLKKETMYGLPVVPFESLESRFAPKDVEFYAAIVYTQLNRLRTRFYQQAKEKGFRPASYISSKAFVWKNVQLGEHCFIFEDNTVQPFVKVGDNVVMWSGNHIGHHSVIHDHCFIASHAVVSGFCNVGRYTFLGVNATIANNVTIGEDNWIGLGATIAKNTAPNTLFKGERAEPAKLSARKFFKLPEN
jgi:sugar O-acyltransferase (sialic acid O-acetyltransferase NeuD family)